MADKKGKEDMHHFFVEPGQVDLENKKVRICGNDYNHIRNVLRMKAGEEILVSDGQGNDYICNIDFIDDTEKSVTAAITEETFEGTELPVDIYLFQGLPKGDKMEMIIQKAVELGVHEVIPVSMKRSVMKLDAKKEANKLKRWKTISESAAKQSRRGIIPKISNVMTFEEALEYAGNLDINLMPYENYKDIDKTGEIVAGAVEKKSIGIFIGPEGGFDDKEVELALKNGLETISLGKRILRTETAGLMIVSVLMFNIEIKS